MESNIIKGYRFATERAAIAARKQAANFYGLPVSPESTTIYFVNYQYCDSGGFWYITWCEGCTEVFGNPIEFEICPTAAL
jgi:hypothetical protein